MVLEVIRIFAGSFEGPVLYDNPNYISPNAIRREIKKKHSDKYVVKKLAEKVNISALCSKTDLLFRIRNFSITEITFSAGTRSYQADHVTFCLISGSPSKTGGTSCDEIT